MWGDIAPLTDCHMRGKSVEIPLKSSPNLTYFKKYVFLYVSNTKFNLSILKICLFIGLSDNALTEVPDLKRKAEKSGKLYAHPERL